MPKVIGDLNHNPPRISSTRPAKSRATKIPSMRSRNAHKGSFVGGRTPTKIYYHSSLEYQAGITLLARLDVVDLWEQPPRYTYVEDGRERTYTFDFLVTLANGRRYLIEVKPARVADSTGLRARLERLATQLPPGCATGILILTEAHLPPALVADAELIHDVRREAPNDADEAVMSVVSGLAGSVTIADVVAATGLKGRAFRAAVRRIAAGDLVLTSPRPISHSSGVALRKCGPERK